MQISFSTFIATTALLTTLLVSSSAPAATNAPLRTNQVRLAVNSASEIGANVAGSQFSYFSELPAVPGYLFDGFLVIGNSANNLSYSVEGGPFVGTPSTTNPFGYLLEASPIIIDSTSSASFRKASGRGFNRDSTLGFVSEYYAPKHPDSADFFILVYKIYKGPKNPVGSVSGLSVAYFVDWNIPSDSGWDNWGGSDTSSSMLFQRGSNLSSPSQNDRRYGAIAAFGNHENIVGGFIVDNPTYLNPEGTWENDSLWNRIQNVGARQYQVPSAFADGTGAPEDLSMALILGKGKTINGAANDTLKYAIVIAGTPSTTGSQANAKAAIDKGHSFICSHYLVTCHEPCLCGDCDNNGIINISDAVCILCYGFLGCPSPQPRCLGDADGNGLITISDAVFIISYVFAGGPRPHCP